MIFSSQFQFQALDASRSAGILTDVVATGPTFHNVSMYFPYGIAYLEMYCFYTILFNPIMLAQNQIQIKYQTMLIIDTTGTGNAFNVTLFVYTTPCKMIIDNTLIGLGSIWAYDQMIFDFYYVAAEASYSFERYYHINANLLTICSLKC